MGIKKIYGQECDAKLSGIFQTRNYPLLVRNFQWFCFQATKNIRRMPKIVSSKNILFGTSDNLLLLVFSVKKVSQVFFLSYCQSLLTLCFLIDHLAIINYLIFRKKIRGLKKEHFSNNIKKKIFDMTPTSFHIHLVRFAPHSLAILLS